MQSPYSNPYLSLRARGLIAYYVELGRVVSADELSAAVPEGRDAIQVAINELKQSGYVKTTREWNGKSWHRNMQFTNGAKELLFPNTGFSGLSYIDSDIATNTSISTSANNLLTIASTFTNKKEEEMGWNLDGKEEEKPKRRSIRVAVEEEAAGEVGKISDKKALRNAKYKGKAEDSLDHRINKPEKDWGTNDLVAEFYDLTNKHAPGVPGQVNAAEVAKCINKIYRDGVERETILKAIRMFFEDPRNLHNSGVGIPLWRRFMTYYPTIHGLVVKEKTTYADEDFLAHQEKMLKLLGGK